MRNRNDLMTAALMMAFVVFPMRSFGQTPTGTDINQAIPIYFGQVINDIIDSNTRPVQVYSIALAKGQQFTATVKTASGGAVAWNFLLYGPTATTIQGTCGSSLIAASGGCYNYNASSLGFTYLVATAGTYYLDVSAGAVGISYQLQVNAVGTPIVTPNPAQAGCLTGQIDYITYSLQLIAAGLPDTVSIGGTQTCATCSVKPPAYPALVTKMERAMSLNVSVSACYDATGNIFQLKLIHP